MTASNGAATMERARAPARPAAALVRELPHSSEAEQGVIGSMLIGGPEVIEEVRARLQAEAFYVPGHQTVFMCLVAAYGGGMAIDLVTFTQIMRDEGYLEQIGGAAALTSMFTFVPTPANVTYYVDIVREKWMLRQVIAHCSGAIRQAYEEQNAPQRVLDDLQSNVIEIGQLTTSVDPVRHIREHVPAAVQEIEATYYSRGRTVGLPSGFVDLDRMTGGFQAPLTYYFAGRPAMGKSSVMVEVAEHLAIANAENGVQVGIFSIEMTGRQLAKRILCARAEVNLQRLRDGFLDKETLPRLKAEAERVVRGQIWIDETSSLDIFEFRARARRMVVKRKVRLIIIDYIQRMHSKSRRAQNNREQEINDIAQGISATAKELSIPIIILAQLNRKNEERQDKVPALSDLRESGSMEQEARFVGLLHRPSYYADFDKMSEIKKEKWAAAGITDKEEFEQYAELIVAKQNEGPVGTIKLKFVKQWARFENTTDSLYSNNPEHRQQMEEEDL